MKSFILVMCLGGAFLAIYLNNNTTSRELLDNKKAGSITAKENLELKDDNKRIKDKLLTAQKELSEAKRELSLKNRTINQKEQEIKRLSIKIVRINKNKSYKARNKRKKITKKKKYITNKIKDNNKNKKLIEIKKIDNEKKRLYKEYSIYQKKLKYANGFVSRKRRASQMKKYKSKCKLIKGKIFKLDKKIKELKKYL